MKLRAGPACGVAYHPYQAFKFFEHPMSLSLEALEIVDTIARRGSFAAAAADLGKVPSAITYAVRKLEEELDALLFDRRGQRAVLTAAGRELLEHGRNLLHAADDLASRVRRVASGWEVELRIALDALVAFESIVPLIDDFYREGAPTRIRLSYEVLDGCWDALASGRADLAIGAPHDAPHAALAPGAFGVRELGRIDFVFCVAPHHPLASVPQPLAGDTVKQHRAVVVADTARALPPHSTGLLSGQDTLTVATLEHKIAAQLAGLGCGWLPAPFAQAHLDSGRLLACRMAEPHAPAEVRYAWRKAGTGNGLRWWLGKLALPIVQQRLVSSTQPAARAPASARRRSSAARSGAT